MSTFESIILIVALFFGILAYLNCRRLKKRFDIIERMLEWKNILNLEEKRWDNLPDEVKRDIKEQNKGL